MSSELGFPSLDHKLGLTSRAAIWKRRAHRSSSADSQTTALAAALQQQCLHQREKRQRDLAPTTATAAATHVETPPAVAVNHLCAKDSAFHKVSVFDLEVPDAS